MSRKITFSRLLILFAGYYGILQSFHVLFLVRAGFILVKTGAIPFPAPPPELGWSTQVIPFLLAIGALDAAAGASSDRAAFVRGLLPRSHFCLLAPKVNRQ